MPGIPLPDPPLGDGAIALRTFRPDDAAHLLALWEDPLVARWTVVPRSPSEALASAWIETRPRHQVRGAGLDLVIADPCTSAFHGAVSLDDVDLAGGVASAAYSLLADHRGHGRASRALSLLSGWALGDLGLHRVELEVDEGNAASQGVAARAGFRLTTPRRWVRRRA